MPLTKSKCELQKQKPPAESMCHQNKRHLQLKAQLLHNLTLALPKPLPNQNATYKVKMQTAKTEATCRINVAHQKSATSNSKHNSCTIKPLLCQTGSQIKMPLTKSKCKLQNRINVPPKKRHLQLKAQLLHNLTLALPKRLPNQNATYKVKMQTAKTEATCRINVAHQKSATSNSKHNSCTI